jgi:hypothetical protein
LAEGSNDDSQFAKIDQALALWRQGDLALDEKWFVQIADGSSPLTEAAAKAGPGIQAITVECEGLVVVTQTCDVVRSCKERHFLEVAPLIRAEQDEAEQAAKGYLPARGPIATRTDLVADLDRTMTVEKAIVAGWQRTPGWATDSEIRRFAQALSRKRKRFAFPDDLGRSLDGLRKRIRSRHGRKSDEGRAVTALIEIRVTASPSWDAPSCEVFLTFVRPEATPDISEEKWAEHLQAWLELCAPTGVIKTVDGAVLPLSGLTGQDYVDSDPLDLDHLTP